MDKYDIGIDPDSTGNGVALYKNGKLIMLKNLCAAALTILCVDLTASNENKVRIHIEDVMSNSAVFKSRFNQKEKLESKLMKAQNVGMCKQAQREVEQMAALLEIKVFKYQISPRWKSQQEKTMFTRATGWKGKSNEDTRSAAYFGFLGVRRGQQSLKAKQSVKNDSSATSVKIYPQ